jgi:hypothetical protein
MSNFQADTKLPVGYDLMIYSLFHFQFNQMQKLDTSLSSIPLLGAFRFEIEDNKKQLNYYGRKLTEFVTNLRSSYLQLPYGDQCYFLKKETFIGMGGFPSIPMMEDFEFVRQIQKKSTKKDAVRILSVSAVTSGRRWKKLGLIKNTLLNQAFIIGYLFGISPATIASLYYGK